MQNKDDNKGKSYLYYWVVFNCYWGLFTIKKMANEQKICKPRLRAI